MMSDFIGSFDLKTPHDLFLKLGREFERLQARRLDQDVAFNFFVTAEHLVDWLFPDDVDKRREMRSGSVLLQVCSHIANAAKHFKATAKHHTSVKRAEVSAAASRSDAFGPAATQAQGWLVVELEGEAADRLGQFIDVVTLAGKLLEFWREFFEGQSGTGIA